MRRSWRILLAVLMTVSFAMAQEESTPPAKKDPLVIGATIVQRKKGCKVGALMPGGPAFKAGVWVGDYISKVNGQSTEKLDTFEVSRLIARNDPVVLELRDKSGKNKTATLAKVPLSTLLGESRRAAPLPPDPLDELSIGDMAPDITAQFPDGKQVKLSDWRGRAVLVVFWAQWNKNCADDIEELRRLYSQYHGMGLEIIGVNLDRDKAALDRFCADNKITWPQHFDGQAFDGGVVLEWGVTTAPVRALIGRDGKILIEDARGEKLEKAIVSALGLKTAATPQK